MWTPEGCDGLCLLFSGAASNELEILTVRGEKDPSVRSGSYSKVQPLPLRASRLKIEITLINEAYNCLEGVGTQDAAGNE